MSEYIIDRKNIFLIEDGERYPISLEEYLDSDVDFYSKKKYLDDNLKYVFNVWVDTKNNLIYSLNGETFFEEDAIQFIETAELEDYYPGYSEKFNSEFWENPSQIYHCSTEYNVADILLNGIEARNLTRGISNKYTGASVFCTMDIDEAMLGSYGDFIFEIDCRKLKANGITPYVSLEEPFVEYEYRNALAYKLGIEYEADLEHGISPYTVVVFSNIDPEYIKLINGDEMKESYSSELDIMNSVLKKLAKEADEKLYDARYEYYFKKMWILNMVSEFNMLSIYIK